VNDPLHITSLTNPRVKMVVKLRQRSHRDELGLMLVEGYREIRRALENEYRPVTLFHCEALYQGSNEPELIAACADAGAEVISCTQPVLQKMAYRDRPEGLIAVGPQVTRPLDSLEMPDDALIVVAEAIEKPGNLGTILRSADATGVHAVIVCDRKTDIANPNVVRASIGTLFSLPVVEADSDRTIEFLRELGFSIVAASPHAEGLYSDATLTGRTAIVVGTEQYGLTETWMNAADTKVRIPMLGQCDSLNVASATTILLYEAVRQRGDV